jgi:hypothetical protein
MLDIGICTNSEFYIDFLINNILKTATNINDLRIVLAINDAKFDSNIIKQKFESKIQIEYHYILTDELPLSSFRHGTVLNQLIYKMSSEYGMFLDQDVAFLAKNWDVDLISELQKDNVQAIGVEHSNKLKYMDFPCIVMSMFRTKLIQDLDIDFRPPGMTSTQYVVQTKEEARCWRKKIGETTILDTGCNFPLKVIGAGYKGIVLPYKGAGALGVGQENHYNGKPMTSHKKASSFLNDKTPVDPKIWMPLVDKFIAKL